MLIYLFLIISLQFQVIIKLKSKHVGGAFSKKNKCKHLHFSISSHVSCSHQLAYPLHNIELFLLFPPYLASRCSKCTFFFFVLLGVVYGVCDETAAWPYRKEREISDEIYFGLKTGQGFLEFKCKNKIHKQRWVDEFQNLLCRVGCMEATERSLEFLSISNSI